MTLEQMRIFVAVVRAGSFTRAADLLDTQKSYVSRVIAALEKELGVKLLERTTRTLSVTEAGREIFERVLGILGAVDETLGVAQSMHGEPRGRLKVTCGVEFGMLAVGHWIDAYLEKYPQVTVDADYTSRVLDVVHEGFDVAIRVGKVEESRLVARPLGELEYGLFACPRYVARHGSPADLDEMRSHSLVMFTGGRLRQGWQLVSEDGGETVRFEAAPRLSVNNSFAVRDALLHGLGIGLLPLIVASESIERGRLLPVLPRWQPAAVPVHAVYPSNRYLAPKVRAFIDLAVERFASAGEQARDVSCKATLLRAGSHA